MCLTFRISTLEAVSESCVLELRKGLFSVPRCDLIGGWRQCSPGAPDAAVGSAWELRWRHLPCREGPILCPCKAPADVFTLLCRCIHQHHQLRSLGHSSCRPRMEPCPGTPGAQPGQTRKDIAPSRGTYPPHLLQEELTPGEPPAAAVGALSPPCGPRDRPVPQESPRAAAA